GPRAVAARLAAQPGERALVALAVGTPGRRAHADRHGHGPGAAAAVRVVQRRLRLVLHSGQRGRAVPLDALRVRAVERQAREELRRHAAAAARVVGRTHRAGATGLRRAELREEV